MIAPAVAGVGTAWLGASLLMLSHGRRGLALGLLVTAAGLGLVAYASGRLPVAICLVAGGVVAAVPRLRDASPGWGFMPTGSTPRFVLCLLVLVAVALIGTTLQGATPLMDTALIVSSLAAARTLTADARPISLAAASALALGLGLAGTAPLALTVAVAGALVAAGLALIPASPPAAQAS
jgi:hypothetical protein